MASLCVGPDEVRGLDTNIILRWLVDDESNRDQCERATRIIAEGDNFLSIVALSEAIWVLERTYRITGSSVRSIVASLMEMESLQIADPELVYDAMDEHERYGGGLNDHLIAALDRAAGCTHTLTFDRKAARSKRFRLA